MYNGELEDVVFALLKGLNTPRSLAVWLCYKHGEFNQLVNMTLPDPAHYESADSFYCDYQATVLLRKASFLDTGVDRKAVAAQKLAASELTCKTSNERIKAAATQCNTWGNTLILNVRAKIQRILGHFDLDEFQSSCGWGPGATFSLRRDKASLVDKILEGQFSVTAALLPVARSIFGRDIHWAQARGIAAEGPCSLLDSEFQIVKGCRGAFVPKDARSDRFIAIEPTANLFIQKGIGGMIRKRLARWGVNLNDQSVNASLAKSGSIDGSLATLDLSSASDSVSRALVDALLPYDWATWLERSRSKYLKNEDGSFSYLEKFSSMGNGFTFELESLIFYALCSELSDVAMVYGDDIVVKTSDAHEVTRALEFLGFSVNAEKSFSTSKFRESCGSHFFGGVDVKPIYIKENPYLSIVDFVGFANSLLLLSHRFACTMGFDPRIFKAWERCVRDYTGGALSLFRGEETLSTGVAYPEGDPRLGHIWRTKNSSSWCGRSLMGLVFRPPLQHVDKQSALLAFALRFPCGNPLSRGVPRRTGGKLVLRPIFHRALK